MSYNYTDDTEYILHDYFGGPTVWREGPSDSTYLKWGVYKPDYDLCAYTDDERSIYHDDIQVIRLNCPNRPS